MKKLDIVIWGLLAVGGLNWGLIGLFGFDVVAFIFGAMSPLTRIAYAVVGLAALYDIVMVKYVWKRWNIHLPIASRT